MSGSVLSDSLGGDASPFGLWSSSIMANSARDPYWKAVFAHELQANPQASETIDATCTRCHAPAASEELARVGEHTGLARVLDGTDPIDELGREGVTCTLCHQISPTKLGKEESFTGGYVIGDDRALWGPLEAPTTRPMQNQVNYTPSYSAHMLESALCATCHTVITRAPDSEGKLAGPPFPEQVPYLEWRNSSFSTEGVAGPKAASCQDCHVPLRDEAGVLLSSKIATMPGNLPIRSRLGRHVFYGGNATMLELLAANRKALGVTASEVSLLESARLSEVNLTRAASLELVEASLIGAQWQVKLKLNNLTGHRFPTAYPTRRAWIQVEFLDAAGSVLWSSGNFGPEGHLLNSKGLSSDGASARPRHLDLVSSEDEVQVYTTLAAGADGVPTHVLMDATQYLLDNRVLPLGWSQGHPDAKWTTPVGVDSDTNFVAGSDTVTYLATGASAARSMSATLWYQSIPPTELERLGESPTEHSQSFQAMTVAKPLLPKQVATLVVPLP